MELPPGVALRSTGNKRVMGLKMRKRCLLFGACGRRGLWGFGQHAPHVTFVEEQQLRPYRVRQEKGARRRTFSSNAARSGPLFDQGQACQLAPRRPRHNLLL
jgi:hypothetical protein